MVDFFRVSTRSTKRGVIEIYPKFIVRKSEDLMIRGGDFYAVWIEDRGLWSTDEQDAIQLVDAELDRFAKESSSTFESPPKVLHLWDAETGMIDNWRKYVTRQMRDSFHMLDEKLIFSNSETNKKDYASKRLPYPLQKGECPAFTKMISTLYSPDERHKIEWAIGAIVTGDSKTIQKFMVLYGAAGTGKSTILNIIQKLFAGYYSVFDAKSLGSTSNAFALEAFKSNPLVAIQHDGDLSRIEDNTRLNSLVSHEMMTVNEKFKSTYANRFKAFLFMGTNKPVRITDAKSGLIRRLIDVSPSGNKLPVKEYQATMKLIDFELGAIAWHCKEVYLEDPGFYESYIPVTMLGASNDFYNFVSDSYLVFKRENQVTLKVAYEMYKTYCKDANVLYPMPRRTFKEELKNYFDEYCERQRGDDGSRMRNVYTGFKTDKFDPDDEPEEATIHLINFDSTTSNFDILAADYPAQYAKEDGTPKRKWENVKTCVKDLDTSKLHYVRVPENHIVIDFDIPDEEGNKCFERNLKAASEWPPTYAELSKSGAGIHLHYIYKGDVSKLDRIYADHVEIKVFTGNSSLRRKLTKCNTLPIGELSSGLPIRGDKMVNQRTIASEIGLRALIRRNLAKEIHGATKPSIDFIFKILEDAYNSGMKYDVTDMRQSIFSFAAGSTHQADYCIKLVNQMKFKSAEDIEEEPTDYPSDTDIVFYDCEVFPNLFLVNWKIAGEGKKIVRMINPTPEEIARLIEFRLVGFNCRRYDNHMLYARVLGYTNEQLYRLSRKIVSGDRNCFFGEAYNISYTDIYDFASAGNKMSLKKLEIQMMKEGKTVSHQELGLPWDEPVPEEMWGKVAEYCDNDVIATEAAFNYLSADWTARQILADLAGMTVNDTTNTLTTKIIFGSNKKPQNEFHYRNLAEPVFDLDPATMEFLKEACPEMMAIRHGDAKSLLPYFPGYESRGGKSTYRGEVTGEGGYAKGLPGMYEYIALLDISSMHPSTVIAECLFGPDFTRRFREIVVGRVDIKHKAWEEVDKILDGKLTPYIQKVKNGEMSNKQLANALKTAINSVYGLTAANFDNAFRDIRNKDNIVAKRGALFMLDLKAAVEEQGFTVAHIKTDSIKIPNATPQIIDFVIKFGKRYGYNFEHEATYEKMCLVNDAVYIAKYADADWCLHNYGYIPGDNEDHGGEWTATGTQFQVPYVFKTLFSQEPVEFYDLCETKSVTSALYLDMNEGLPDVSAEEKELSKLESKYKKGELSDITFENECKRLQPIIEKSHAYHFIGRVGLFCPIKKGCGGGELVREKDGKYYSATGAKGWRWMEAEMVKTMHKEDDIDRGYYIKLANDAIAEIEKYGNYDTFSENYIQ